MPIDIGKCPVPFPHISNNRLCRTENEVSEGTKRMWCNPYIRLMTVPTKSYLMKKADDSCAPKDSLDLALSSCYDQHRQWWVPKQGVKMQCATYSLFPWGRAQHRIARLQCMDDPLESDCSSVSQNQLEVEHESRNSVHHLDISIASPHLSNSNRGYGRSTDGAFFNC